VEACVVGRDDGVQVGLVRSIVVPMRDVAPAPCRCAARRGRCVTSVRVQRRGWPVQISFGVPKDSTASPRLCGVCRGLRARKCVSTDRPWGGLFRS
jgi:hypothetical protein